MDICVFCSANFNIDSDFFDAAKALGQWIAEAGHTLVFGGTNLGLMESIGKATKEAGGKVVGVVPTKVEENGCVSQYMDVSIACNDLNDRKAIMMERSHAFVALPGGIGTLDEIFTVVSSATIGYHQKPLFLYNINGFWDSLIACLDDLHERKVTRKQWRSYITVVNSLEELQAALEKL